VYGQYRFVKYARFLLDEYFTARDNLTKAHAEALAKKDTQKIAEAEKALNEFNQEFFAWEQA
jgi:hypothetical protein